MENVTLSGLMESEREMVMGGIARDRSPAAAQAVAEKVVDRVMYRYLEQCGDARLAESARLVTQTMKQALPLMDSVGESRRWERNAGGGEKRRAKPIAIAMLVLGTALVLAVLVALTLRGGSTSALTLLKALLQALLGIAVIFWAGIQLHAPQKREPADVANVREEYLVDAEKLWHTLRGMMMQADAALDQARGQWAVERQREAAAGAGAIDGGQAAFFSGLLENAYALEDAESREMIESIRFYLHGMQVEAVDYEKGRESWFEFLPAQRPGTIRPALVSGDRLIRKGLASA